MLLRTSGAIYARNLFLLSYVSNVGVYYKPTAIEMHDTLLLSTPNHYYDHCKKQKQKQIIIMTTAKTEDSRYPALHLLKYWDCSRLSSKHTWKVTCAKKSCEKISRLGLLSCLAARIWAVQIVNTQQLILSSASS